MHAVFNQALPLALDKGSAILVVDDFDAMRRITVNQLRQLGAENILTAKDGRDALRILKSTPVERWLYRLEHARDVRLELLKAMREDPKLLGVPFIMITAEAERPRIEEAIASGVTSMVLKPFSPRQLMARVEKALSWKPSRVVMTAREAPAAATPTAPDTPKEAARSSLLIVDDTPDNLTLLSQLLKDEYRVRLAQNGAKKALEICTSDNPPDLVLLDIMMPDMDGFEVARRMREHPNSENTPVIFVTAMTSDDARMKGLDLGAVDFITKPINPLSLKYRVRNFMRYVHLRKNLQADYDGMVEVAQLREHVEHIARHDIKGPLAGVLGLLQGLIDDDSVRSEQLEQLRLAEETALQALNMINLSSELFKIEAGRFQLQAAPVAIGDILRRIATMTAAVFPVRT